jgi:transposase
VTSNALAGRELTDEHLRAFLPAKMRMIASHNREPRPDLLDRLPEFDQQHPHPGLPGWSILRRSAVKSEPDPE